MSGPYADSHLHLLSFARALCDPDLGPSECPTLDDVLGAIRRGASVARDSAWCVMRGFDDALVRERRLPRRSELDVASPLPLRIRHRTGHASLLNSAAFDLLPSPPLSARMEPDDNGDAVMLIGVESWLNQFTGQPKRRDLVCGLRRAAASFSAAGIGRIWDATPRGARAIDDLVSLLRESAFPHEVRWMRDESTSDSKSFHDRYVKLFPARLEGRMRSAVDAAHAKNSSVAIHVATEAELDTALDALESSRREDLRDRLEHVPLVTRKQARRIATLGACVVTHPGWLVSRHGKYRHALSKSEQRCLFPFRTLVEEGVELAFSSDAPIEMPDPIQWQYIATSRNDGEAISTKLARYSACGASLWGLGASGHGADRAGCGAGNDRVVTHVEQSDIRRQSAATTSVTAGLA